MRAAVFRAPGVVEAAEVLPPAVGAPTEAIVRVTRAAICGSDLHFFHGKAPMEPGTVMGHEAVGVVAEVGPDVARVRVGDRVCGIFSQRWLDGPLTAEKSKALLPVALAARTMSCAR